MNKTILIVALGILLIGGGVFVAQRYTNQTGDTMVERDLAMDNTDDSMMEQDGEAMDGSMMNDSMSGSRYVEYSPEAFEHASDTRRVLFFYANWCPTCRPADADFQEQEGKIPEDVTLIRVNYNDDQTDQEEEALSEQYNVTYQHTFVQIDEEGNAIATWNGGQTEELLKRLK